MAVSSASPSVSGSLVRHPHASPIRPQPSSPPYSAPPAESSISLQLSLPPETLATPKLALDKSVNDAVHSHSWADIVKMDGSGLCSKLKFFPPHVPASSDGALSPPPEVIEQGNLFWGHSAVGYFLNTPPHFMAVKAVAMKLWARFGVKQVAGNESGFFFFRFPSEEMLAKCLSAGPWTFSGKPIFLKRWSPGMELSREEHKRFPIWIKMSNIPLELWSTAGLCWMASAIGTPLQIDPRTGRMENLSFAKICVEVGVDGPFPSSIAIQPCPSADTISVVKVAYSWKPTRCARCNLIGHLEAKCLSKTANNNSGCSQPHDSVTVDCNQNICGRLPVTTDDSVCSASSIPLLNVDAGAISGEPPSVDEVSPPIDDRSSAVGHKGGGESSPSSVVVPDPRSPGSTEPGPSNIGLVSQTPSKFFTRSPFHGPSHCDSSALESNDEPACPVDPLLASDDALTSLRSGGNSVDSIPSVKVVPWPIPCQLDLAAPTSSPAVNQECLMESSGCMDDSLHPQMKGSAPNSPDSGIGYDHLDLDEYLLTPASIKRISLKYSSNSPLVDELAGTKSEWKISKSRKKKKSASRKSRGASGS